MSGRRGRWACGTTRAFARDLRATVAEEPHAGVRRHLVVVLAGAGERRSVRTMAVTIPTSACARPRCNTLPASPGRRTRTRTIFSRRCWRGERRCCSWDASRDCAPTHRPALWDAAAACVTSADRDLRWAAYEAVMRHGAFAQPGPELARDFLNREPERPTRVNALRLLLHAPGSKGCGSLIEDGSLDAARPARGGRSAPRARRSAGMGRGRKAVPALPGRMHGPSRVAAPRRGSEGAARPALLRLFVADGARSTAWRSWGSRGRWTSRSCPGCGTRSTRTGAPLDESERQLRQELADFVDRAAGRRAATRTSARASDPDLCPSVRRAPSIRCPSLVLRAGARDPARLAALEVH